MAGGARRRRARAYRARSGRRAARFETGGPLSLPLSLSLSLIGYTPASTARYSHTYVRSHALQACNGNALSQTLHQASAVRSTGAARQVIVHSVVSRTHMQRP